MFVSLFQIALSNDAKDAFRPGSKSSGVNREDSLTCKIATIVTETDKGKLNHGVDKQTVCLDGGDLAYDIQLKSTDRSRVQAGDTVVLHNATIAGYSVQYAAMSIPTTSSSSGTSRSHNEKASGSVQMMVLRVITSDASPQLSSEEIQSAMFGTDNPNVATRLDECSFGKFTIANGTVLDIFVDHPVKTSNRLKLQNQVSQAAAEKLGDSWRSSYAYVAYVFPEGISFDGDETEWFV